MPTTDVWTKNGYVTMTLEQADAYLADQERRAQLRRIETQAHAMRALKTACAVVTVGFGLLMIACTAIDFLAGVSTFIGAALGLAWAIAGVVCGIETWRGAGSVIAKKDV